MRISFEYPVASHFGLRPGVAENFGVSIEMEERVETWNDSLRTQATAFAADAKEATVLLFSSHQLLSDILEDPLAYDLTEDDPTTEGGGIWIDDLHLTEDVHRILGEQLFKSLFDSQSPKPNDADVVKESQDTGGSKE